MQCFPWNPLCLAQLALRVYNLLKKELIVTLCEDQERVLVFFLAVD